MAFRYVESMLSFIQGNDYCAIVQHWGVDGGGGLNSFDLAKDLAQGLTASIAGKYCYDEILPIFAEDTFISSVRTREVAVAAAPSFVQAYPTDAWVGTFSGEAGASQDAACAIWLSGADAGLTGRTFFPGVSIEALESGRFVAGYKSPPFTDVVTAVLGGIVGATNDYLPFIKHGPTPSFAQIIHGYLSPTPGTIRKRRKPF